MVIQWRDLEKDVSAWTENLSCATAGVHCEPGAHPVCGVHHAQHCIWHAWRLRQRLISHGEAYIVLLM